MKNTFTKIVFLFLLALLSQVLFSQATYQVVTRKIEKEFSFSESDYLIINAEKGIIDIKPGEQKKVIVRVNIVVKNRDITIAKKELEYIKWDAFQKYKELKFTNTISLPQNKELSSIVRVEYTIYIPQGAHFSVYNKFGQVKVSDLSCVSKYNMQYCDMNMKNTSGNIYITSNVGDFNLTDISGILQITSRYSSLQLTNPSGDCDISATYGDVKANLTGASSNVNIKAEKCNVSVSNRNCLEINLNLETKYGEINLLEPCYVKNKLIVQKVATGSSPNTINTFKYSVDGKNSYLKIITVYGNISLN